MEALNEFILVAAIAFAVIIIVGIWVITKLNFKIEDLQGDLRTLERNIGTGFPLSGWPCIAYEKTITEKCTDLDKTVKLILQYFGIKLEKQDPVKISRINPEPEQ